MFFIKHIPNIISLFRVVLIPFFIWQMLVGNTVAAAIILAVSGATDFLDGWLARHFNWVSAMGKVLDPAADKLTQVSVCVMLIITRPEYWYFFAFLIFKELVMLILGGWLVRNKVKLKGARWFGKVVTFLFYLFTAIIIFFGNIPHWVVLTMLSVVSVCALIAGLLYIPQYRKYRRIALREEAAAAARKRAVKLPPPEARVQEPHVQEARVQEAPPQVPVGHKTEMQG